MKNKLRFILPRLIALTAVVGLASLIIGTIFKLLLFTTILFAIGAFMVAKMRNREIRGLKMGRAPIYPNRHTEARVDRAIVPLQKHRAQKNATIVPVY
ncbi:hypothetical protein HX021_00475 [Sphingobacterium sp. N143]|uniref:hypothetical protein n=1 Tax=Sphingobacterium sp. N143 TaxID=2746727 RepID=UPI002575D3F3|nr:hypothetical protein [Sphingobacterium sp. N143]MDM1292768.1 hypothetical protein [Sphingobacterium sp. N143]